MILISIAEGIGFGALLVLYCLIGIKDGAVGMVHLYDKNVQERCVELGLTTRERIKKRAIIFKVLGLSSYVLYVIVCTYLVNGARGFTEGFLQLLITLSVCNLIDRILIDELWVCHTNAWNIEGTEDLKPYITKKDKVKKWISGTVGMAAAAAIAGIMALILK